MITVMILPFGLGRSCMWPYLNCPWSIVRHLWCLELPGPPIDFGLLTFPGRLLVLLEVRVFQSMTRMLRMHIASFAIDAMQLCEVYSR